MSLSPSKIKLLREFVNFTCEQCNRHEDKVGKLTPHRINRKGEYCLRNIKMVCNYKGEINGKTSCHKLYHANEFPHISK